MSFWKQYRHTVFCVGAVAVLALLTVLTSRPQVLETGAWGLSFQTKGAPPIGNASVQKLAEYDAAFLGSGGDKTIYITFDAGYENGCTGQILDVLRAHNAPAAFFVVGSYLDKNPELVCRMVSEGHLVGNHTYSHPDMGKIADRQHFAEQLQRLEKVYQDLIGEPMSKLYRPPQGKYSTANLAQAKEMGYTTLFWSLAYVDWYTDKQPSRETALQKLVPRIHPGAVVLLHSTSATNAAVLDELLTKWESLGYTFGDVRELMA